MALINCPECGNQVSDLAKSCPQCAYPIESLSKDNIVRIKLSSATDKGEIGSRQKVNIFLADDLIWEGEAGQVAELDVEDKSEIRIVYLLGMMNYKGETTGVIDFSKGMNYNVTARKGAFKTVISFHKVDIIDSE